MCRRIRRTPVVVTFAAASLVAAGALAAEEAEAPKAKVWSDAAELGLVATDGNSETLTLGLKNTLVGKWGKSSYTLGVGAVRGESTTFYRVAVGPDPGDYDVVEESESNVTADLYYVDNAYARTITDRSYWGAAARWERNRPAGVDNRTSLGGLYGNVWFDRKDLGFRTEYGLTATWEGAVVEDPAMSDPFLGFRFGWLYRDLLGSHTTFTNKLVVDENLDETSDLRSDMLTTLAVAMSEKLALQVSLQFLYDHEPALEEIPLEFPRGTPTGDRVVTGLDDLDTIFTASLVVHF